MPLQWDKKYSKAALDKDAHQCDFLDRAVAGNSALPLLRALSLVGCVWDYSIQNILFYSHTL
jgi:hypothetical protein